MQNALWMRPALQQSEAVLMTAMPRRQPREQRFRSVHITNDEQLSPFRPVPAAQPAAQPAASPFVTASPSLDLSTFVRPRGSMAGRGVLRAAGFTGDPYATRARPRYHTPRGFVPAMRRV